MAELAQLPGVWRGGELAHVVHPVVATGHAALDRELPGGGWPLGTLSEVLHDGVGLGEVSFLAGALARASQGDRLVAWVNPPHLPYAPALAQAGLAIERCAIVRPANRDDALWAAEQALRSGACGAVLLWLAPAMGEKARDDARERGGEYAWLRRLQMAAAAGRAMAVLFRAGGAERLSTPAHLRVVVTRAAGLLQMRIAKRRGPPMATSVAVDAGWRARENGAPPRAPQPPSLVLIPVEPTRAGPRIAA